MAESSLTIGSLLAMIFGTIIVLGILQPIMVYGGVFNPELNSTTPAGNYIRAIYGTNGLYNNTNRSIYSAAVIPFASASSNSVSAVAPQSLQITSGYAFIAGGIGIFWSGLSSFPSLLYVMMLQSVSYGGLQSLLPYDLAAFITIGILGYISSLLALKLLSLFTKPGNSIENI